MGNHSDHGHGSSKKAVFGAPLIMGLSFWLFAFFFLSFCDGPGHHAAAGNHDAGSGAATHEAQGASPDSTKTAISVEEAHH
jgi:hypothetical protein